MEIYEQQQNSVAQDGLHAHMTKTFLWMFAGVGVTFGIALILALNPEILFSITNSFPMFWILMIIAQFAVVIVLSARLMKMNPATAKILYLVYAVITGVTFSTLGYQYETATIGLAFGMACIFFGSLAVIGITTKKDLTKIGSIAMAGLLAMIIYGFIAWIFKLPSNTFVYSMIGLLVFAGLTAWDTQKIKKMYFGFQNDERLLNNMAIFSAFQLYLDFLNIFLYILRIVGNSRD